MKKYKIINIPIQWSQKKLILEVESILDEIEIKGGYKVVSVSFSNSLIGLSSAFITLQKQYTSPA